MSIVFSQIPITNFSPGAHTEIDLNGLVGGVQTRRALIIGYTHGSSPGPVSVPTTVSGSGPWPRDSMISRMIKAYRATDPTSQIVGIGLAEPPAGADAEGTVTVTGTATEDGTIFVYVAGKRVQVGVSDADSATTVAAAIAAAVSADPDVPCTAASVGGVATITSEFAGSEGNRITLDVDAFEGEDGVAGIATVVASFSGGSGEASLADALALVAGERYYTIVSGLSDATSLTALTADIERRWRATIELLGHGFAAVSGSLAEQTTEAGAQNTPWLTLIGAGQSLTPRWEFAAQVAGADTAKADPLIGFLDVALPGLLAPANLADRPDKTEREQLLAAGVSTFRVSGSGLVLDRVVTTRTQDSQGDDDFTQLAITFWRTLEFLRSNWRSRVFRKFKNFKLADSDDVRPLPGTRILTPATMRSEAAAWFVEMRDALGLVQDLASFQADLQVVVNGSDPNRLDLFLPPKLIRELVTIATVIQPR
jgi:phage tail sheath gpL-like